MKAKGVLLDIDNTLYDYEKTHRLALNTVFKSLENKFSLGESVLNNYYQIARKQINKELSGTASSHNRILYFQRMFEILDKGALKDALNCYNLYWDTFIDNLEIHDGVVDFLKTIKHLKICLVSDLSAEIQHRKIKKMKLFDYATFLVTSEEAGKEKPDPNIFMLSLKKLGLRYSEVCMIGDSYEKDIIGATNLKIFSYWFNKNSEHKELNNLIIEFKSFRELIGYWR